jgi:16S rRNA (cytidine1402-2'-O)-methyltransferase
MSGPMPVPPGLHFVATPIGTARDITLRALDTLAGADVLAAEDTRTARKLMELHGVALGGRPLVAYHDHNGPAVRPRLLAALADGKSVAYVSEAGTPLVADPGFTLARAAIAAGYPVHAVPGPSAVMAALTVSGLPTDRFLFAGFPPVKAGERRRFLEELAPVPATLVLFEAPGRAAATLAACRETLGDREAALCRELTKRFEEVRRGTLADLAAAAVTEPPRGEVVLVIDRGRETPDVDDMAAQLREALKTMRVKDAASAVAEALSLPRRQVYQAALKIAGGLAENSDIASRQDEEADGKE